MAAAGAGLSHFRPKLISPVSEVVSSDVSESLPQPDSRIRQMQSAMCQMQDMDRFLRYMYFILLPYFLLNDHRFEDISTHLPAILW
jgi:hypothetical protein